MDKKSLDIVIGSGAGDEGKGIITARIAKAYNDYDNTIVILNNGGAQRGHSVSVNGKEHIFKHFGSATPLSVESYFGPKYILNPMQFVKEKDEIYHTYGFYPKTSRNEACMWSTPWDMMVNQIHQKERWTGSCGMGIWETIKRYECGYSIPFSEFCTRSLDEKIKYLLIIRDFYFGKIEKVNVTNEYYDAWFSDGTINHFISDCENMFLSCMVRDSISVSEKKHVIIENGQGLLLNDDGTDNIEKTPSETGIRTLYGNIEKKPIIHFVTRPYLTRHGSREWVNDIELPKLIDNSVEINQYNEWQRDFYYSPLSITELKERCDKEIRRITHKKLPYIMEVTHCDEMDRTDEFRNTFLMHPINFYDTKEL